MIIMLYSYPNACARSRNTKHRNKQKPSERKYYTKCIEAVNSPRPSSRPWFYVLTGPSMLESMPISAPSQVVLPTKNGYELNPVGRQPFQGDSTRQYQTWVGPWPGASWRQNSAGSTSRYAKPQAHWSKIHSKSYRKLATDPRGLLLAITFPLWTSISKKRFGSDAHKMTQKEAQVLFSENIHPILAVLHWSVINPTHRWNLKASCPDMHCSQSVRACFGNVHAWGSLLPTNLIRP